MTIRAAIMNFLQQDEVNFVLTNYLPRRSVTRLMGWFSRIEQPLICVLSLRVWRLFTDLDLSDARDTRFRSLHECFTRRLKDGARPIEADPAILASPCDGIVGAVGTITGNQMCQIKGSTYALEELLGDAAHADIFRDGSYVTLRLTSAMYHRFHAPHDCHVSAVTHIFGDAWNVNPPALRHVERLFCKNERAVIRTTLSASGHAVTLVPVAAILVAGIRLTFMDLPLRDCRGAITCDVTLSKGEEMGWFEHGSTIIVLAARGFKPCESTKEGLVIRAGQALMIGGPGTLSLAGFGAAPQPYLPAPANYLP